MTQQPIHVRLTAWYLLSLTIILTFFAAASWYAMKVSIIHSIDRDLNYRLLAVTPFIQSHSLSTSNDFRKTFAASSDSSVVGVFVQVSDDASHVLYESDVLASHHVPPFERANADGSVTRTTVAGHGWPVRVASKRVVVDGIGMSVHVVEPLRDLLGSLHELTLYFVPLVCCALLVTALAGYWISRRALAPVEQLRREADAIDPADLTARLRLPPTDDELARLAVTLNSMLARIEAGFRSVEQFTADASHELRAPLALILTAGEVSLRHPRSQEELADVLGKIIREARRMSKLVDDLLALARGDAHLRRSPLESVELKRVLAEVAEQVRPAATTKGLRLEFTFPDKEVHLQGLEADLRRLFLILLDNAIKYTDQGAINVTLIEERPGVRVTVSDTGIGLEPNALPHLFKRFWRADKVRSRAEGGVGLGLALAAQLTQRHHGTISASGVRGVGSVFVVEFPLLNADSASELSQVFQTESL